MMKNMRNKLTPKTLTIREFGQKEPLNVRTLNTDTFSNRDAMEERDPYEKQNLRKWLRC